MQEDFTASIWALITIRIGCITYIGRVIFHIFIFKALRIVRFLFCRQHVFKMSCNITGISSAVFKKLSSVSATLGLLLKRGLPIKKRQVKVTICWIWMHVFILKRKAPGFYKLGCKISRIAHISIIFLDSKILECPGLVGISILVWNTSFKNQLNLLLWKKHF